MEAHRVQVRQHRNLVPTYGQTSQYLQTEFGNTARCPLKMSGALQPTAAPCTGPLYDLQDWHWERRAMPHPEAVHQYQHRFLAKVHTTRCAFDKRIPKQRVGTRTSSLQLSQVSSAGL